MAAGRNARGAAGRLLVLLVLPALTAAPAARAAEATGHAGVRAAGGSRGYWRAGGFGGLDWEGTEYSPFLSAELAAGKYSRDLELLGGSWKKIAPGLRAKAGLGLVVGRLRDSDEAARAWLLELGVERELARGGLGADWRLTSGSIGGGQGVTAQEARDTRARRRGIDAGARHYSYNELSGYGWLPVGSASAGGRATLGLPSYAGPVWTFTASLRLPLADPAWSLTPSVSVDRGSTEGVYGGLALSRRF